MQLEDRRFGLYIDGEAGCRQEVVECVLSAANVGRASIGKVYMHAGRGTPDCSAGRGLR